jgi:ribose/xylose/arabinose/galactoside ABC-type transport system permease subunit
MADEFVKGLGALTGGLFVWMVLAGWYQTPHFDGLQLIAQPPETLDVYGQLSVALIDVSLWFAILGALVFWVLIPGIRQGRSYYAEESE